MANVVISFQMVGLPGFQMAFKNQTICQPNRFGAFEFKKMPGKWILTVLLHHFYTQAM